MGIKQEIAVKRGQIEHWLGVCEDSKIYSKNRKIENEQLFGELEGVNKNIVVIEDQNQQLENELDKFLTSDNEIRGKLADRNSSPLKVGDLYKGMSKSYQQSEFMNISKTYVQDQFQQSANKSATHDYETKYS